MKLSGKIGYSYFAGFVDGEGCLTMYKEKCEQTRLGYQFHPLMRISNTNKEIIERIAGEFGGFIVTNRKNNDVRKPVHVVSFNANLLRKILPNILNLLVVKEEQCILLLEALDLLEARHPHRGNINIDRLNEIYKRLRFLNKRGVKKCRKN